MAMRRVIDSNPRPSVLQGLVAPPTLSTLHLSLGLCNNLAGWASPHSPCTLYALERPAPSSYSKKVFHSSPVTLYL